MNYYLRNQYLRKGLTTFTESEILFRVSPLCDTHLQLASNLEIVGAVCTGSTKEDLRRQILGCSTKRFTDSVHAHQFGQPHVGDLDHRVGVVI